VNEMQVYNKVRDTILQYWDTAPETITMEACIKEDVGADAIAIIDIMMDLEEAYNMHIPEKTIGLRVGTIVRYIEENSAAMKQADERKSA